MKVLAVSHDSSLYGAQRSLMDAVAGLVAAGHNVEVCVPKSGALEDRLRDLQVKIHVLPFTWWVSSAHESAARWLVRLSRTFPGNLLRACRLVRAGRYDVVYTNTVTVLDFALAAKLLKVPHVWHLRESAAGNSQLRSLLPNRAVVAVVRSLSARVIYNSYYLLARYGSPPSDKDVVVYNGIPPPSDQAQRMSRDLESRVVVTTIGYMERRKGLDVLLDAMALLPKHTRARMVLRIVGHIEKHYMRQEITSRLERLGGSVELLGWVERVDEVLASTDLLVSSARDEPFGRTLIEAMMAGVPVLATRSGGPQEIVIDGVTGELVPSDDAQQLCTSLARLLRDPSRLRRYGRAGRERALSQFSLSNYVREIERCLEQAMTTFAAHRDSRLGG